MEERRFCDFFLRKLLERSFCFFLYLFFFFLFPLFNVYILILNEMCNFYFKALNQNAELRSRLNRIHSESVICDQVVSVNIIPSPDEVRLWPLMDLEYKQTLLLLTK